MKNDKPASKKMIGQDSIIANSTVTCPKCGEEVTEIMTEKSCQFFWECANCEEIVKPKHGDCCVYCTYVDVPCPPVQQEGYCC